MLFDLQQNFCIYAKLFASQLKMIAMVVRYNDDVQMNDVRVKNVYGDVQR